jgi:AcrR family transcriptional regulator
VKPAPRLTKDPQRTRQALLRAAQAAFCRRGYRDVGVREITAEAGVSVALVNRYFGGKEQLFKEALADLLKTDRIMDIRRDRFGEEVLDLLFGESDRREIPLAMILLASGDGTARDITQAALTDLVFQPLAKWLGGEEGRIRAAQFMMLSSGLVLYNNVYPLDVCTPALDPRLRAWLVEQFQALASSSSAEPR